MIDFSKAFEAARKYARQKYPEEMCGFVIDGEFVPVKNQAASPSSHDPNDSLCPCRMCRFEISSKDTLSNLPNAQFILHSHPNRSASPSEADMKMQIATNIPWGIISLDHERTGQVETWGDQLSIRPLLGRNFLHGISDCYSLIRDVYRTGKDELARQGITTQWPFNPIVLKEVPRDDAWWDTDGDLYNVLPSKLGWREVSITETRPGDLFLLKVRSNKFNHGGVLISNDMIMHHLPNRFSRREPSGIWFRQAGRFLRYIGEGSNG